MKFEEHNDKWFRTKNYRSVYHIIKYEYMDSRDIFWMEYFDLYLDVHVENMPYEAIRFLKDVSRGYYTEIDSDKAMQKIIAARV